MQSAVGCNVDSKQVNEGGLLLKLWPYGQNMSKCYKVVDLINTPSKNAGIRQILNISKAGFLS